MTNLQQPPFGIAADDQRLSHLAIVAAPCAVEEPVLPRPADSDPANVVNDDVRLGTELGGEEEADPFTDDGVA
ncbi:MAG: hypothetical protein OEV40_27650 [Acidimicrobiia bacterium]|nr:hypothetical protein [Acidimicrobiia bacterium]